MCTIYDRTNGTVLTQSKGDGNLYGLHVSRPEPASASIAHSPTCTTLNLIHKRLGHPSASTLHKMIKRGLVTGIMVHDLESMEGFVCDACIQAKMYLFKSATSMPISASIDYTLTFAGNLSTPQ